MRLVLVAVLVVGACGGGAANVAPCCNESQSDPPQSAVIEHQYVERHDANPTNDIWFWMWMMNSNRPFPYVQYAPTTPYYRPVTPRYVAPKIAPPAPKPVAPKAAPPAPKGGKCDITDGVSMHMHGAFMNGDEDVGP